MTDYLMLMHNDVADDTSLLEWAPYLKALRSAGLLRGGSAIASGCCVRRGGVVPPITDHIAGFIKIEARDLDEVRSLLTGNPVYEAGGTIEIRELPRTD